MRPLIEKVEDVYVIPGSDAEEAVQRRFPAKVSAVSALACASAASSSSWMDLARLPAQQVGLTSMPPTNLHSRAPSRPRPPSRSATSHSRFRVGTTARQAWRVTADARTWLRFAKDAGMPWAIVTGKIRLRGLPLCWPSDAVSRRERART